MPDKADDRTRFVARSIAEAIGGKPQFHQYYNDNESAQVAILSALDRPSEGWTSYATVSLHDHPVTLENKSIAVELVGLAAADREDFANVIATCALNVIVDDWLIAPGVVHPDVVASRTGLSKQLSHVLFVPVLEWPELNSLEPPAGPPVYCLQAVPISENERQFLASEGLDSLEKLFTDQHTDYFDLDRTSAV